MPGSIKGNTWSSLVMMEQLFQLCGGGSKNLLMGEGCTGPSSLNRHVNESVFKDNYVGYRH